MEKRSPYSKEALREELLDTYPKEMQTGLNYGRVESFVRSLGMKVKPYIVVNSADLPFVQASHDQNASLSALYHTHTQGIYSTELDLVIIKRNQLLEAANGPIITEGLLVHELSHANSMFEQTVVQKKNSHEGNVKTYAAVIPWGWFFEEGFADMHRAGYVLRYASDDYFDQLKAVYNAEFQRSNELDFYGKFSPVLPPNYYFIRNDDTVGFFISSFAGYGFELLSRKHPQMLAAFIKARESSIHLDRFVRAVDSIYSELYTRLKYTSYTEQHFRDQLAYIERLVGLK